MKSEWCGLNLLLRMLVSVHMRRLTALNQEPDNSAVGQLLRVAMCSHEAEGSTSAFPELPSRSPVQKMLRQKCRS
jgi:hypothetical protein